MTTTSDAGGGIGVLGALGVLFVALRLTGTIDWSWWWVTAPFWGPVALLLVLVFVIGVILVVEVVLERWR